MIVLLAGCMGAEPSNWQDADGDGYFLIDCDDDSAEVYPGAREICDGIDNDCDGEIDGPGSEGSVTLYRDEDGDGYGPLETRQTFCGQAEGFVSMPGDCDDADPTIRPDALEVCDGLDNNCNAEIDENAIDGDWFYDNDRDGYTGTTQEPRCGPDLPSYWRKAAPSDCDDTRSAVHPGAEEICDGHDNDCDGLVDDDDTDISEVILYSDVDLDGFGDPDKPSNSCPRPANSVSDATDCDDSTDHTFPGSAERCDDKDNDCDGLIDEEVLNPYTWYADSDGDGEGTPYISLSVCHAPSGYVRNDDDCNDEDSDILTTAVEVCDGVDNDCDGLTDDDDSSLDTTTAQMLYADDDGDGYGDASNYGMACIESGTHVIDDTDCDDGNPSIYPDAPTGCTLEDWNCDGEADYDLDDDGALDGDSDGDGYSAVEGCDLIDCDDEDDTIYPEAEEVCGDGNRNDCLEQTDIIDCFGEGSLSDQALTLAGESSYDYAGRSVSSAGDVNGDGQPDLLIGAYGRSNLAGAAYVVLGPVTADTALSEADARLLGVSNYHYAGMSVAGAGDVDGDGYDDLLIGAYGTDDAGKGSGSAYLIFGPVSGDLDLDDSDGILIGESASANVGERVAAAGDVNGDGLADLLIGAPGTDGDDDDIGAAYLLHGPVSGDLTVSDADAAITGWSADEHLGYGLSAGDLDGDGVEDLVLGASGYSHSAGIAYVFFGPVSGELSSDAADTWLVGQTSNDLSGHSLSVVGDTNGDGLYDVLIGGYGDDEGGTSSGSAWLVLGPATTSLTLHTADAELTGSSRYDSAGHAVAGAGDLDGDGNADLLIGAHGVGYGETGSAYVVLGPVSGSHELSSIGAEIQGETFYEGLGWSVAGVGDMDNDGWSDVLLGAPSSSVTDTESGAAYLVLMTGL